MDNTQSGESLTFPQTGYDWQASQVKSGFVMLQMGKVDGVRGEMNLELRQSTRRTDFKRLVGCASGIVTPAVRPIHSSFSVGGFLERVCEMFANEWIARAAQALVDSKGPFLDMVR